MTELKWQHIWSVGHQLQYVFSQQTFRLIYTKPDSFLISSSASLSAFLTQTNTCMLTYHTHFDSWPCVLGWAGVWARAWGNCVHLYVCICVCVCVLFKYSEFQWVFLFFLLLRILANQSGSLRENWGNRECKRELQESEPVEILYIGHKAEALTWEDAVWENFRKWWTLVIF